MKKKKISFIYFDIGGVLLRWEGILDELAKFHHKDIKEVWRVFKKYDDQAVLGEITHLELTGLLHKDLRVPVHKKTKMLNLAFSKFEAIAESHVFIKSLIGRYPLGILSNIYSGFYEIVLKNKFIPDLKYDVVIKSCEVGLVKPDPKIYLHAQKKAQTPAEEILFIDDREDNIAGALTSGWQGFHFDKFNPAESIQKIKLLLAKSSS